jgi:hypothetical protein
MKALPPRIGETVTVIGTVRTVEALWPDGHYRITMDVSPTVCNCDGDDGDTGHDVLCPRLVTT